MANAGSEFDTNGEDDTNGDITDDDNGPACGPSSSTDADQTNATALTEDPGEFQFDLEDAFKKLSIATRCPSDENLTALEWTFRTVPELMQIFLGKRHSLEETAILIAAGMRSTKTSIDLDIGDFKESMRRTLDEHSFGVSRVHVGHFSYIKEIFRRLSVLEERREAFPTFARDPTQPLPDVAIRNELDGMQVSLHALQRREDLTSYFNKLRHDHNKLDADTRPAVNRLKQTTISHGTKIADLIKVVASIKGDLCWIKSDLGEIKRRPDAISARMTLLESYLIDLPRLEVKMLDLTDKVDKQRQSEEEVAEIRLMKQRVAQLMAKEEANEVEKYQLKQEVAQLKTEGATKEAEIRQLKANDEAKDVKIRQLEREMAAIKAFITGRSNI